MNDIINKLNDQDACDIFQKIVENEFSLQESEAVKAPELRQALTEEYEITDTNQTLSDGEMARQALQVLAMDNRLEGIITSLANKPKLRDFSGSLITITDATLVTAMILVLKTAVKIERDKDGKYSFEIKVKGSSAKDIVNFIKAFAKWPFARKE